MSAAKWPDVVEIRMNPGKICLQGQGDPPFDSTRSTRVLWYFSSICPKVGTLQAPAPFSTFGGHWRGEPLFDFLSPVQHEVPSPTRSWEVIGHKVTRHKGNPQSAQIERSVSVLFCSRQLLPTLNTFSLTPFLLPIVTDAPSDSLVRSR